MFKRLIIFSALSLFALATILYLALPNSKSKLRESHRLFVQNRFAESEALLQKIPSAAGPKPIFYYQGLLALCKNQESQADLFFKSALKSPCKNKENLVDDLYFAKLIELAGQEKYQEFFQWFDSARPSQETHFLYPFFSGLYFYGKSQFKEAQESFANFAGYDAKIDPWLQVCFLHFFPKALMEIRQAHCLIETKEFLLAHKLMEKIERDKPEIPLQQLNAAFLGLTALFESKEAAVDQRKSFYHLAGFYFEKSGQLDKFVWEKRCAEKHIEKHILDILETAPNTEQRKCALEFVPSLQRWHAIDSLEKIAPIICKALVQEKGTALCQLMHEKFYSTPIYHFVTSKMVEEILGNLKNASTEEFEELWAKLKTLSPSTIEADRPIAALLAKEMNAAIKIDDHNLSRTYKYLFFWQNLESKDYESIAEIMFSNAKVYLYKEGQEKKGLILMDLAYRMNEKLYPEIESFLTKLYEGAENSNMIRRLTLIFEAIKHFEMPHTELASPNKIANYLADAEYLYIARNYSAAEDLAQWVLRLDPKNDQAYRLVGLSSFHIGEYAKAFTALKKISTPDEYAVKALILSEALLSEKEQRHLVQIDNLNSFKENE